MFVSEISKDVVFLYGLCVFFCMRIVYKCSCVSVWAEAIWGFYVNRDR